MNDLSMTRREAIAAMTTGAFSFAAMSARAAEAIELPVVESHDRLLQVTLKQQVTHADSPWRGGIPDQSGLHHCGSAARLLRDGSAAFLHPASRFHGNGRLLRRLGLAARFLDRWQGSSGNIDLLTTNFNSSPDTGFVVHDVGTAARLAQLHHHGELLALTRPFLIQAGQAMINGGIHTPNHRWVVCAALAQIHELFPDDSLVRRIDEWLAEGIDIDEEGQFIERSTSVYNAVSDNSLVVMAEKLGRWNLLEPVRQNLRAMAYLLHSDGEVVTEISRRQDLNMRASMAGYWFSLRYLAVRDGNGLFARMLQFVKPDAMRLSALMEYRTLRENPPAPSDLPDDYEKHYPISEVTRIRRGKTSITLMQRRNSRWISIHHGAAVINAIRFATAFFGKGQFVPDFFERQEDGYSFGQELEGVYYQPLADEGLLPINRDNWLSRKAHRRRSEICRMTYTGKVKVRRDRIEVTVAAEGTKGVPLAVEINFREGGMFSGVTPVPDIDSTFVLGSSYGEYRLGSDLIKFGPGQTLHTYTQIRGAHDKLPGPSVYITGYTPFRHTLHVGLS